MSYITLLIIKGTELGNQDLPIKSGLARKSFLEE